MCETFLLNLAQKSLTQDPCIIAGSQNFNLKPTHKYIYVLPYIYIYTWTHITRIDTHLCRALTLCLRCFCPDADNRFARAKQCYHDTSSDRTHHRHFNIPFATEPDEIFHEIDKVFTVISIFESLPYNISLYVS